MSRQLTDRSIDHVVLERGEVANSWRTERWPSLRLLTPNWQTTLPGFAYEGDDPDGFMTAARGCRDDRQVRGDGRRAGADGHDRDVGARRRRRLSRSSPTKARGVRRRSCSPTAPATWRRCRRAPTGVPSSITSLTPQTYRGPDALDDGGVLVVGASSTGVQLADEIARSGRAGHPRRRRTSAHAAPLQGPRHLLVDGRRRRARRALHRGRRHHAGPPRAVAATRRHAGRTSTSTSTCCSRTACASWGASARITDGVAAFAGSLTNIVALADLKMNRLLNRFDEWAGEEPGRAPGADPRRRVAAARTRPPRRRHPHHRVGDGLPARLLVARRARRRPQGLRHPRRRRRYRRARHVRGRHAVPAPPPVDLHQRRSRRHRRTGATPSNASRLVTPPQSPLTRTCATLRFPSETSSKGLVVATVELNGTSIWYHREGSGPPCLVLHGGLGIEPILDATIFDHDVVPMRRRRSGTR